MQNKITEELINQIRKEYYKHWRAKNKDKVRKNNISELNCVCFNIPVATCIKRNAGREGRARVPDVAIYNMFKSYNYPTKKENFTHVYEVDEYGLTLEVEVSE